MYFFIFLIEFLAILDGSKQIPGKYWSSGIFEACSTVHVSLIASIIAMYRDLFSCCKKSILLRQKSCLCVCVWKICLMVVKIYPELLFIFMYIESHITMCTVFDPNRTWGCQRKLDTLWNETGPKDLLLTPIKAVCQTEIENETNCYI